MSLSDVPTDMQLKIIDLQFDSNMNEKFASFDLEVQKYLFSGCPKLRDLAANILCMF